MSQRASPSVGPRPGLQSCLVRTVRVPERFRGGIAPSALARPEPGGTLPCGIVSGHESTSHDGPVTPPQVLVAGPVSWNRIVRLDALPQPRPHTVFARGHHDTVGGTSAGKALNLASLGAAVTLSSVVGGDR
jgi:hypothetical protein